MKQGRIATIVVLIASLLFVLIFEKYKQNAQAPSKINAESVRVALITDNIIGNNQFLIQAHDELKKLATEYNITTKHIEAGTTYLWNEAARGLCESGYDLIIGLGWQGIGVFEHVAKDFPDTRFAVIDTKGNGSNIRGIEYNAGDSSYALGVMLATAFPDEKTFGYIGNFIYSSNFDYENAFKQGVLSVNPQADFAVEFASTYSDQDLVRQSALRLINQDVRVIMASVSSAANEGIYKLALEKANEGIFIYTTGLSIDQTTPSNPYIIGGLLKDTALPVRILIEDYLHGTYINTDIVLGVAGEGFGVVHLGNKPANFRNKDIITDEVIEAGNAVLAELLSGKKLYTQEKFTPK